MAQTVADVLLARLREWNIKQVFAFPGDGINGLLAAWGRAGNDPQFVQARHEEMAAFEAVGYAKFSGNVAVCAATSGPGAIHLLNGLYDAKLDHVPVVAIVGQTERSAMGGSYQQEVDLLTLFKDVCSDYVQMCTVPEQLPNLIDRAIRVAVSESAPTCIIIPSDVFDLEYVAPGHAFKQVPSSVGMSASTVTAEQSAVRQAAAILNAGEKVALLLGQGARGCVEELTQISDLLGAGAAKALLGKDVLSDELAWVTGSIGLLGTIASYKMMMGCDTLLTVGSNFPYTQFMPKLDQARAIQIDRSGKWIGMRYPYELNLVGDAKATLQALIPLLERKTNRSWREQIESDVADWWATVERRAMTDADPVNPMRIFHELSQRLPANAIVAADSGSAANWYARHLKFHDEIRGSLSGTLATMGPGVPYVIGAKWAHPDRPAIALVGDGAMQMNGMAELITVAHYWQQWTDPRLIVAILHNNDLNQVTWEMRAMEGAPKFAESQTLPDVDFAAFARTLGLSGVNIDTPDAIGPAWETAFAADRPTVLDIRCDPDVPPIPRTPPSRKSRPPPARSCTATKTPGAWSNKVSNRKRSNTCPAPRARTDMRLRHNPPNHGPGALVAEAVHDVRTGRFERSLSALTAAGAVVTTAEIYMSHDGASFGNKMMWWPIVIVPTAIPAGVASVFSARAAHTVLPLASAAIVINGLQGTYLHLRGVAQRPGGITCYNLEAGPPVFAPLLASLVGGMGLLAALLRREGHHQHGARLGGPGEG